MPHRSVKDEIHALVKTHGVSYVRTRLDDWADDITRLCDDEIVLDETEELLVGLERNGVITGKERTLLHARYLSEKKSIRPETATP